MPPLDRVGEAGGSPRLVLIGGPPGVGKTSVLAHVERACGRCACLDADDAWRVHPSEIAESIRPIAERNVTSVLRGYFEAGYPLVFLSWVLANPRLIERLLRELAGLYTSTLILHLVASPEALKARCARQAERPRRIEYALLKLEQIEQLPYPRIDTTLLGVEAVADLIVARVRAGAVSSGSGLDPRD